MIYSFSKGGLYACSRTTCVIICLLVLGILSGCGSSRITIPREPAPEKPKKPPKKVQKLPKPANLINPQNIPQIRREMRGVWIATVDNIDWPSKPGLPVARQKAELRAQLDRAEQLNMNAVFFQVRPAADALYKSPYEPWSYFLTGQQERPPQPNYDPLRFAVREAHKRGLELHAWFNPFRAYHPSAPTYFAPGHVKNTHPGWVLKYGRQYWINPGIKAARQYSIKVILDVARRYNIDGVHLDDYFYPYPRKNNRGRKIPFPDAKTYHKYVQKHGEIDRSDWRRQNINKFVETLHRKLRKVNPKIRFGISPFGIWRPGHPPQIKGYDAFARIYADSRKWLRKGWVDYLAPQLYWPVDQRAQSFPALLQWWTGQNFFHHHLWPGLYTNRVGQKWKATEIRRQIQLIRHQQGTTGEIHFSMKSLMNNAGHIADSLLNREYRRPALVPATSWLSDQSPPQPDASLQELGNKLVISLSTSRNKKPWLWIVKLKYGNQWIVKIIPGWKQSKMLAKQKIYGPFRGAVINVINRLSVASPPQMLLPLMRHAEQKKSTGR